MVPARTGRQRPRASGLAQNVHLPVQAASQQTPSTQKPDAHSPPSAQSSPLPLGPQLPATQLAGAWHLSLLVQLFRQLSASQVAGAQGMGAPDSHSPSPLHRPGGTNCSRPWQVCGWQTWPAGYFAQPPRPLQTPLCPQDPGGSTLHTPCWSGEPAGTGRHSPRRCPWLQLTQAPVQPTSQQTPSAQNPESHCEACSQGIPCGSCRSQRPWTQASVSHSLGHTQGCPTPFLLVGPGAAQAISGSTPRGVLPPGRSVPPSLDWPATRVVTASVPQPAAISPSAAIAVAQNRETSLFVLKARWMVKRLKPPRRQNGIWVPPSSLGR
jgi:hypothetical protein